MWTWYIQEMATKDERKKGTAAKDILEKRNVMIISVLKPNPNKFFGLLRQDSLVTTDEYDPDNTPVNKENQATKLFFLCSRRVEIKPSDFSKVLDILSTYSLLDEVVDEMKREGEFLFICMCVPWQFVVFSLE